MTQTKNLEVWLRGPLPDMPSLLQPVAHALLQAREEVENFMQDFPAELLWERPAGVASVGYHLQHLVGVLERLFTYARGEALTEEQLAFLYAEGKPAGENARAEALVQQFHEQVDKALEQLRQTDENTLTETRRVGRAQVESTVMGLLFHAAEHSMRHVGQLLVTARVLRDRTNE
ncbi:DinB family protein [Pontibacter roseus]|uniref:DinB family protein n=1 Tax=Pontibacter roseus TaxID=336989 RepID=UPI000365568D|nr:DinB family protein [Pontibacter roseus]